MADYSRDKPGFRFENGGTKTNDVPDAIPPGKYAALQNVRSTGTKSIRTRPGYNPIFLIGTSYVTDIRAYTALGTDNLPRLLARDENGVIWLDNGTSVMVEAAPSGNGAMMLPFRPAESPATWMYVAGQSDYNKISAPNANNNVSVAKVGIAEPQQTLDACPTVATFVESMSGAAANWSPGGTAGNTSDGNRSVDALVAHSFQDPAYRPRQYCPVGNNANAAYNPGELVNVASSGFPFIIEGVYPALTQAQAVSAILYANNSNVGSCVIALGQLPVTSDEIAGLQRGSILTLHGNNGAPSPENILVLDAISGPNGQLAIETTTNNNWSAIVTQQPYVVGIPSIAVYSETANYNSGASVVSKIVSATVGAGIGTFTQAYASSPFTTFYPATGEVPQGDDYFHISVAMSDPTQLNQMLIIFPLGGSNLSSTDLYYYAVDSSALVNVVGGNNNTTQLSAILETAEQQIITGLNTGVAAPGYITGGNNQFTEILFNLSQLTRQGSNESLTLANCLGMQLQFNVANNVTVSWGSVWIGSGGQPDIGNEGAPYKYAAVPLASTTGVRGNPTALMRYGVSPQRQSVNVRTSSLSANYDTQIDTWEVYRYGGSVTSYRFLGTAAVGSDFLDNLFDDAAQAGKPLAVDNTEPWPTIGTPWQYNNNGTVLVYGNQMLVGQTSGLQPQLVQNWLPGTLFRLSPFQLDGTESQGGEAFTLRYRPIILSPSRYQFVFEECIGSLAPTSISVLEPNIANQPLPYIWGPNAYGDFFGVGGVQRPGVVQWSKPYAPDASPTANTLELCAPAEPLLGGETIGGIDIVASSERWWALYFQSGAAQRYQQVEIAVGRRLAAPYGKCKDGSKLYFWATDCIAVTGGGEAVSLTDDLYNLFPHGGLQGVNVARGPVTFYAPDYSRAVQFRIAVREGIIYALYVDTTGTYRMLIGEIRGEVIAWSYDAYASFMSAVYALEQPKGTLSTSPSLYPAVVMGTTYPEGNNANAAVVKLQDFTNDGGNANGTAITGFVYTTEWDAGDLRASDWWGDQYVDAYVPSGTTITVTPVTQGNNVAAPTTISGGGTRLFNPVSLGGGTLQNFLGLQLQWTDNFATTGGNYTTLHAWQPSFIDKPEIIKDRFGDWVDFGAASFVQGFLLHADTFGYNKTLLVRNADDGSAHYFTGPNGNNGVINHNGEQRIAYSFPTPFVSHLLRYESEDNVPWRYFDIEWVKEPTAEVASTWTTQWSALGSKGYKTIPRIEAAYASSATVTLTITSYDGQSPSVITLPSSGGATIRTLVTLTFNKGQLYKFSATSTVPFQLFLNDFIVHVCDWGGEGERLYNNLGDEFGDKAKI